MKTKQEIYEEVRPTIASDEAVGQLAYEYWERGGRKWGDEEIDTFMGRMKRREYHWLKAKTAKDWAAQIEATRIYWSMRSESAVSSV